jgi:hypothetical protein
MSAETEGAGPEPDQPSQPPADASPDRDRGAKGEEEQGALEYELPISPLAAARTAFGGNTFNVAGDFLVSDGKRGTVVSVADITAAAADAEATFVEPPSFAGIVEAISSHRVVLVTGRSCGNRVAAAAALRATEHDPILELPAGVPAKTLVDATERACKANPRAGILVYSLDADVLGRLAGFELRRLRGALPAGAAVALTAQAERPEGLGEIATVVGAPPDPVAMVKTAAAARGLPEAARARALAALECMEPPVSPAIAVELLGLAGGSVAGGEELAAMVAGQSPLLDEWLSDRPAARSVAALAAAAALEGLPYSDCEAAEKELARALEGEVEPEPEERRFGPPDSGLPPGVVGRARRSLPTHFGRQEAEVVEIQAPYRRELVLTFLWRKLGSDFRQPFLAWLRDLPAESSWRVAQAAAISAGALFAEDPIMAERELLRPWGLGESARGRDCAALSLGVPVATGADPTAARLLARTWATGSSLALRQVAVLAYGGPLGVWDPGAAAAGHLWDIPFGSPQLGRLADRSMAALAAGGAEAGRARATVIALLLRQAEDRQAQARVYALLPLLLSRLTGGSAMARESLESLLGEAEHESLRGLATLLAQALDTPGGYAGARLAVEVALEALAQSRIGSEAVDLLLAEVRIAGRERGRLPQLESQLGRVLGAKSRGKGQLSEVARSVRDTFDRHDQGGTFVSH